jgi:hypothetical protein
MEFALPPVVTVREKGDTPGKRPTKPQTSDYMWQACPLFSLPIINELNMSSPQASTRDPCSPDLG